MFYPPFPSPQFQPNNTNGLIVVDVQTHRHTKSCQRKDNGCRYKFPRYPCPVTILARPYSERPDMKDLAEEEQKAELIKRETTVKNARDLLNTEDVTKMTMTEYLEKLNLRDLYYYVCKGFFGAADGITFFKIRSV